MILNFLQNATTYFFYSFGNILLNGFASNISQGDKKREVGIQLSHFNPINKWSIGDYEIVDMSTKDVYCDDSKRTVRFKCAALFAASFLIQPIGLTLNLLNRISKIASFAHLWNPSEEKYHFKARIAEWGKDILVVVSTPLILVGMFFSALYGATLSPYDGRKLYASFERFAYSGGYQFFNLSYYDKTLHTHLMAPCFQPNPTAHVGGGDLGEKDVW